ncbi:MAG: 16S rRNA (guanine(527)-N(7))-methyltransferase RsmG [bacterium]|nr:16S rRNA (guanine(527)-N(7))-methyltransferase RsmG [bacterium]
MRKKDQIAAAIKKVFPQLPFEPVHLDRFELYLEQLERWNAKINLTAVTGFEALLEKHILDSLAGLEMARSQSILLHGKAIDLGSGAGLPGLIIAALFEQVEIDSIDGVGKKAAFQETLRLRMGLKSFAAHGCRYEEWVKGRQESYDFLFARALASMPQLMPWARDFLKSGGEAWLWKGELFEHEWAQVPGGLKENFTEPQSFPYQINEYLGGRIIRLQKL